MVTLKRPISAVERTCVPPHSSRDHVPSPTSTMRTTSPYFSPNSAVAPSALASLERGRERAHRMVGEDPLVDLLLDVAQLLGAQRLAVREVEAQLVGPDVGARLAHVRADALAQRRVQQVRRGVVARRRAPVRRIDARDDALALAQLALLGLEHERLVVAEPHDVDHARAAVAALALDDAGVGDLPAARRVERRLDELEQHAAVRG